MSPAARILARAERVLGGSKVDVFLLVGPCEQIGGSPYWQSAALDRQGHGALANLAPDSLAEFFDRLGVRSLFTVSTRPGALPAAGFALADALSEESGLPVGVLPAPDGALWDRAFEFANAGQIARPPAFWLIASPKHVRRSGTNFLAVDKAVESQVLEAWKIFEKVPHASAGRAAFHSTAPWLEVCAQLIARADRDLVEQGTADQDPGQAARAGSRAAIGFIDRLLAEAET